MTPAIATRASAAPSTAASGSSLWHVVTTCRHSSDPIVPFVLPVVAPPRPSLQCTLWPVSRATVAAPLPPVRRGLRQLSADGQAHRLPRRSTAGLHSHAVGFTEFTEGAVLSCLGCDVFELAPLFVSLPCTQLHSIHYSIYIADFWTVLSTRIPRERRAITEGPSCSPRPPLPVYARCPSTANRFSHKKKRTSARMSCFFTSALISIQTRILKCFNRLNFFFAACHLNT